MKSIAARIGSKETPPTLWAYAVVAIVGALIGFGQTVGSYPAAVAFASLVVLVLVVLVLRGSRIVWCLIVVSGAFQILSALVSSPKPWWTIAIGVIALACLLAPMSWRFVWRPRPAPSPAPASSMDAAADDGSGWQIDPESPSRMRYWSAKDQRWLGVAKTPRKLRKLWLQQQESESVPR